MSALSLADLLERVAARTTAPGGAAVVGVVAALAGALAAMAGRFAEGADRAGETGGAVAAVAAVGAVERARALGVRAVALAEHDLVVYAEYVRVRRAGAGPEELAAALAAATQVPLELAEVAAQIAALALDLAVSGNPRLRGDAAAAVLAAAAATRAAAVLVCENLEPPPPTGVITDQRLVRAAAVVAQVDAVERTLLATYPALTPSRSIKE